MWVCRRVKWFVYLEGKGKTDVRLGWCFSERIFIEMDLSEPVLKKIVRVLWWVVGAVHLCCMRSLMLVCGIIFFWKLIYMLADFLSIKGSFIFTAKCFCSICIKYRCNLVDLWCCKIKNANLLLLLWTGHHDVTSSKWFCLDL